MKLYQTPGDRKQAPVFYLLTSTVYLLNMLCLYCGQSLTNPPLCCQEAVEDYSNSLLNESSKDTCITLKEELTGFEIPTPNVARDVRKKSEVENYIFYGIMGFWAGMTVTMVFLISIF